MDDIQKFIGSEGLTVSEAMLKIDKNSYGILFLVNQEERLTACITDGDIRRYLLRGGKMDGAATDAANHKSKAPMHNICGGVSDVS